MNCLLHRPALVGALVFCLGVGLFWHTVDYPLLIDDAILIPGQTVLRNPWALGEIFGGRYWGDLRLADTLYRPVTIWTLAVNYGVNDMLGLPRTHPVGYRVVNILLNGAVGCVAFVWLRCVGLGAGLSALVGLLFVVHPIHTEVVTSVVNRSESLAALFGLLFLCFHWHNRILLGAACFFLALCSKESAVAFLPLAFWTDYAVRGVSRTRIYGVWSAVLVFWIWLRNRAVGAVVLPIDVLDNPLVSVDWVSRVLTAARVQLDYVRLQVFPVGQSSDYSFAQIPVIARVWDWHVMGFLVCVLMAIALAWMSRRNHRAVLFAVGGYILTAALTSNFLFPIGTLMGERLMYMPSLFLCLAIAYGVMRLPRSVAVGVSVVGLAGLIGATSVYSRVWADAQKLYQHQVLSAPNSAKAHYNLGTWALRAGLRDLAIQHLKTAVEIYPDYADAWNNLGTAYGEEDADRAIAAYQQAVTHAPNVPKEHFNLGQMLQSLGDLDGAIVSYRRAIALAPDYVRPYINLGSILADRGQLTEARILWERALRLEPENEAVQRNLELIRLLKSQSH